MNEIALRYGQALYSLALEENDVSNWQKEVKELTNLFVDNKEFLTLLSSGFISLEEKELTLDKTLKGVKQEIINLIKLVVRNHRVSYLLDIFQAFNSFCNEFRGVKEGLVYSSEKLDNATLEKINAVIGEKEHCKVELYNHVDSTLIGGVKVVIDGHIYDGSIKEKINQLKQHLL